MHLSWIIWAAGLVAAGDQSHQTAKESSITGCDLAGSYRFRFRSNGHDGWWFRFKLEGSPASATLVEDIEVLDLKAGPLGVTTDPARCRLILSEKGKAVGKLVVAIELDAKADTISGKLTRTKATDQAEKQLAITGVRDRADASSTPACIVPGIYKVAFDPKVRWRNADKGDKRSCKHALDDMQTLVLRIESFGKTLAISKRGSEPPYKEGWASDSVIVQDDCHVTAKIEDSELKLEAKLTFAGKEVTGTAIEVTQQVIEGDADIWNCVGKKVPLTVTLEPP